MSTLKEERALHDTKRAAKDRREVRPCTWFEGAACCGMVPSLRAHRPAPAPALQTERRQSHAKTGQECEHGVWRCKICFPHKEGKPRYTFV